VAPPYSQQHSRGGRQDEFYRSQIVSSGGKEPHQWTSAEALPEGLTIDKQRGIISGIPIRAGSYTIILSVKSLDGGSDTSPPLKLKVELPFMKPKGKLKASKIGANGRAAITLSCLNPAGCAAGRPAFKIRFKKRTAIAAVKVKGGKHRSLQRVRFKPPAKLKARPGDKVYVSRQP